MYRGNMLVWTYSDIFDKHGETEKIKSLIHPKNYPHKGLFFLMFFNCRSVASWPPKNSSILLNARLLDNQYTVCILM